MTLWSWTDFIKWKYERLKYIKNMFFSSQKWWRMYLTIPCTLEAEGERKEHEFKNIPGYKESSRPFHPPWNPEPQRKRGGRTHSSGWSFSSMAKAMLIDTSSFIYCYACICAHVCAMTPVWNSEYTLWELVLAFCHVGTSSHHGTRKTINRILMVCGLCRSFCLQVPAVSSCPDFSPWRTLSFKWDKPFPPPHKFLLVDVISLQQKKQSKACPCLLSHLTDPRKYKQQWAIILSLSH